MSILRVCLLILACTVLAQAVVEDGVHILSKGDFDDFINRDIVLVEFFAPWCGHCKKLAPEYAKAAKRLSDSGSPVALGSVDATVEGDLASRFGVTGYPTLKVFRNGAASEYKGPREAEGIVNYMQKQAAPSITTLSSVADVEKFLADDAAIVYFGKAQGDLYTSFSKLAEQQRETFRFARTEAQDVLDKYAHKDEIVILHSRRYTQSPLEAVKAVAEAGTTNLLQWIQSNILPFVGEIHSDNQNLYSLRDKPLIKFYTDVDWKLNNKGANYLLNKIRKVAKEYSDKFTFAVASRSKHQKEIDDMSIKGEMPFAIHHLKKGHKYPSATTFTVESFKQHVADFLAEKLEPYLKSEPVPENQPADEPVVVVGKNFDQIVTNSDKDVLLEAYAPWCGHCKTLEPKYKELAAKMQPYADQVTIAKIDATANDIPPQFAVKGFPTIFFIPANKKSSPLNYDGPREVDGFVNYIKKHASKPLKEKKDEL